MKTLDIILTVVIGVMAVSLIVDDVRLILLIKKAEKKTVAVNIHQVLCLVFIVSNYIYNYFNGRIPAPLFVVFCVAVAAMLPLIPTYITSQGVPRVGLKVFIEPAEKISYEYAQGGLFKETLLIYRNGSEVPIKLHFDIKSPKLITILNDNYVKHGYENPLLKEQ